jgi:hypothetical protein
MTAPRSKHSISSRHWSIGLLLAASAAAGAAGLPAAGALAGAAALPGCSEAPLQAAQTGAQRLTWAQYGNSVHDLLGDDVVVPPVTALEPDVTQGGFASVGASIASISARGVEQYEKAGYDIAKQALAEGKRKALVPCTPSGTADEACARAFVQQVGRRVFRRPLEADEVTAYAAVSVKAATGLGDFYKGLEYGLSGMLQSPGFLFRAASGEPDPEHAGKRRYTSYEMASRLSYFLWNSTPDAELLEAAEAGALVTDAGLAEQAKRLLASPRARQGARSFYSQYLGLDQLDTLSKDPKIFVNFSPELGPAAREETLRVFESIAFDDDGDYRDIFTTRRTFVNPKLAALYHVPAPVENGFGEILLPEDGPRQGLLGHASILALNAHPVSSSATLRGKFIRTTLLCGTIPSPPVNVNTALPEPSGTTRTLRERVKEHLVDPGCASCHRNMDPIGLGLENFDGLGAFRKRDNDAIIDASGELDGVAFADARELGVALREHPKIASCFVSNLYRYATSFVEAEADVGTIEALTYEFSASGHKVKSLLLTIVMSPGFRLAQEPQ